MRATALLLSLAGAIVSALPQAAPDDCTTIYGELIIPTKTATYTRTAIVTTTAATAENLGTYTTIVKVSSTITLQTLTPTAGVCDFPALTTLWTTAEASNTSLTATASSSANVTGTALARYGRMFRRQQAGCTDTVYTLTTTYGGTYTYLSASQTSTYTAYTAFSQATTTRTSYGGAAYAIATASVAVEPRCLAIETMDARCAPSAMVSATKGYGLSDVENHPITPGASYETNATDASSCCQICVDAIACAGSAWDIRTNVCVLEFTVGPSSRGLECGHEAGLAFYDIGPISPMAPGSGWYVADMCGHWGFGSTEPDDET